MGEKKNQDDWNFKVDEEHLEQVQLKKATKKANAKSSGDILKKKGTSAPKKKRTLTVEGPKKKKMTRAAIARRDAALKQQAEIMPPNTMPRVIATIIDYGFIAFLYGVGTFLTPILNEHYLKLLRENGINQTLDPEMLNVLLAGSFTFAAALIFFFIPAGIFLKTPGKAMMKIRIGHPVIGERPSKFMVFLRELIFKPLSVASVLGVLIGLKNDGNRCLHDFLSRTALYIDD